MQEANGFQTRLIHRMFHFDGMCVSARAYSCNFWLCVIKDLRNRLYEHAT